MGKVLTLRERDGLMLRIMDEQEAIQQQVAYKHLLLDQWEYIHSKLMCGECITDQVIDEINLHITTHVVSWIAANQPNIHVDQLLWSVQLEKGGSGTVSLNKFPDTIRRLAHGTADVKLFNPTYAEMNALIDEELKKER